MGGLDARGNAARSGRRCHQFIRPWHWLAGGVSSVELWPCKRSVHGDQVTGPVRAGSSWPAPHVLCGDARSCPLRSLAPTPRPPRRPMRAALFAIRLPTLFSAFGLRAARLLTPPVAAKRSYDSPYAPAGNQLLGQPSGHRRRRSAHTRPSHASKFSSNCRCWLTIFPFPPKSDTSTASNDCLSYVCMMLSTASSPTPPACSSAPL